MQQSFVGPVSSSCSAKSGRERRSKPGPSYAMVQLTGPNPTGEGDWPARDGVPDVSPARMPSGPRDTRHPRAIAHPQRMRLASELHEHAGRYLRARVVTCARGRSRAVMSALVSLALEGVIGGRVSEGRNATIRRGPHGSRWGPPAEPAHSPPASRLVSRDCIGSRGR